ncbi:Neutral metalloprotease precursor [compost metagenome]
MAYRLGSLLMALSLAVLTGCNLIPPTGPSEINTRLGAEGRVRQFFLGPQSSGLLTLGTGRKLLFAVSSGAAASRAGSFRVQGEPDAPSDPHGRFRESSREIAAEAPPPSPLGLLDAPVIPTKGATQSFWVNIGNSQLSGDRLQEAKLIVSSSNAHFFVDTHPNSAYHQDRAKYEAQVQELATMFDATIFPRVSQSFGAPPSPGIDQDPRIYVVISPAVDNFGKDSGLMGYFWSRDLYQREHSNEKEIIFLTDKIFKHKPWTTYGTLAHEYTHLVVYNQKVLVPKRTAAEETWLDEAMAMLAMDLCGFGLRNGNDQIAKDIDKFQANPDKFSLTDWFRNPDGFSYGLSYLFARYLYDRYSEGMIRDLLRAPQVGVSGIEQALSSRGISFEDLYSDWSIANAISGLGITTDPRYSYAPEVNLRGSYGAIQLKGIQPRPLEGPSDVTGPQRPWGTSYYLLGSSQERTWTMDVRPGLGMFGGTVALP